MKNKRYNSRQEAILRLIEKEHIGTQEEMQKKLNEAGFPATQSTVSRDIRVLHLVKKGSPNQRYYCQETGTENPLAGNIVKTEYSGNMIVIHCASGTAQAVCAWIDSVNYSEIVGTIAGDDTIFVLVRSTSTAKKFAPELEERLRRR